MLLVACKDKVKERIGIAIEKFKELLNLTPDSPFEKKFIIQGVAKMISKYHKCGKCCQAEASKEDFPKFAEQQIKKFHKKHYREVKKKAKKVVKNVLSFCFEGDDLEKKVLNKVL